MQSNTITITIQPGKAYMETTRGKVLSVKNCTLPIVANFNGGAPFTILAGTPYNEGEDEFRFVNFVNPQTVAVTITYSIGEKSVPFFPQDNQQKVASTYAKASNIDVTGTTITTGILIPGTNNGHSRKQIVFTVQSGVARVQDLTRVDGLRVTNVTPITIEGDADFYIYNESSNPTVLVMEIYYKQ